MKTAHFDAFLFNVLNAVLLPLVTTVTNQLFLLESCSLQCFNSAASPVHVRLVEQVLSGPGGFCAGILSYLKRYSLLSNSNLPVLLRGLCLLSPDIIHKFIRDKYSKRFPELESLVPNALDYIRTVKVPLTLASAPIDI